VIDKIKGSGGIAKFWHLDVPAKSFWFSIRVIIQRRSHSYFNPRLMYFETKKSSASVKCRYYWALGIPVSKASIKNGIN